MFQKDELRLLWPFYLYRIIADIFGIGSLIWTVYFVQKGFSFTEVGIAMAFLSAGLFLFEVPTGAIADIFGRKISVSSGYFLFILFPILVPFVKSFIFLILLFILMAIAVTLISGAEEAWIIDYLKKENKNELIQEYYIKIRSLMSVGIVAAGLFLTGVLFIFQSEQTYLFLNRSFVGSDFVWFIQAAGMSLVIVIILLFTKEEFVRKKKKIHIHLFDVFHYSKKATTYVKNHSTLLKIFIAGLLMGLLAGIWGFAYQPMLLEFGFKLKDLGWLRSLAAFFGIFIPFIAKIALKKYNPLKIIRFGFILEFITTLSIILIAGPIAGMIYFMIIWNIGSYYTPVLNTFIQKHIPSKLRATITSLLGMLISIGMVISTLIAGPLLDIIGARKTVFFSAFIFIPIIWIYFKIKR